MRILAIDPGPENSALVNWDVDRGCIVKRIIVHNEAVVVGCRLRGMDVLENDKLDWDTQCDKLVIEKIASYGMPVGEEVFATCRWTGRFMQSWMGNDHTQSKDITLITRGQVKMHRCGSMRAKDSNIHQALLDRFGPGKDKAVGTKKNPGPLYGVVKDIWAALAVAVTWSDLYANKD